MADSEIQQPVDSTQQVTSKNPVTHQKNPKRVATGKAIADKTKAAREAQKKALAEVQMIIANHLQAAAAAKPPSDAPDPPAAAADPPSAATDPPAAATDPPADQPPADQTTKSALTTTQWLSVISIFISVVGVFYKREEIKKVFSKKAPQPPPPPPPITCGCRAA